jgi:hypothetical protein
MTDRVKGFIVTLDTDIRIDEIQTVMQAIRCMRRVANVEPSIVDPSDWINQQRVKSEIRDKMYYFIKENL